DRAEHRAARNCGAPPGGPRLRHGVDLRQGAAPQGGGAVRQLAAVAGRPGGLHERHGREQPPDGRASHQPGPGGEAGRGARQPPEGGVRAAPRARGAADAPGYSLSAFTSCGWCTDATAGSEPGGDGPPRRDRERAMETTPATTMRQRNLSAWPRYEAAVLGFRNYWYPVTWSHKIGKQPLRFQLLGDPLMFYREQGKVYAFYDQCPHRGIPLSVGRQEFPGTWSCRYHGWTFDFETGVLKAALTDGPDSPICGKVRVKTYPVEERAGLVWAWMGEGTPTVPVEDDIPPAFLGQDAVIVGRISTRKGNWRYAAENGFDEAHAKYLHRYGSLWTMFRHVPAWAKRIGGPQIDDAGVWLSRPPNSIGMEAEYPGLGPWPPAHWWKSRKRGQGNRIAIRLPGCL